MTNKEQAVKQYWLNFCDKRKIDPQDLDEAFVFGATKADADELSDLVNRRIKTATTSIHVPTESSSQVGKYCIVLDGDFNPVCVIQNKVYEVMPFKQASQEHAYHEGEGDRSYKYWYKVHWDFFTKECQERKQIFNENTNVVCEVFTKIE